MEERQISPRLLVVNDTLVATEQQNKQNYTENMKF